MVASIVWEYLHPLVQNDSYLMDEQIIQFFFDLMNINREEMTEVVFKSIDIHFSMNQLIDWQASFMHILCQKIP